MGFSSKATLAHGIPLDRLIEEYREDVPSEKNSVPSVLVFRGTSINGISVLVSGYYETPRHHVIIKSSMVEVDWWKPANVTGLNLTTNPDWDKKLDRFCDKHGLKIDKSFQSGWLLAASYK